MSSSSFGFSWVYSIALSYRRVHSCSLWLTRALQIHVRFIRIRLGSLGRFYGSSGSVWIARVHSDEPRGLRVHSGSRRFTRARLVVAISIQVRVG